MPATARSNVQRQRKRSPTAAASTSQEAANHRRADLRGRHSSSRAAEPSHDAASTTATNRHATDPNASDGQRSAGATANAAHRQSHQAATKESGCAECAVGESHEPTFWRSAVAIVTEALTAELTNIVDRRSSVRARAASQAPRREEAARDAERSH